MTTPSRGSARPRRLAGLPHRTAWFYAAACLLALAGYGLLWPHAPVMAGDSPSYLAVARDLSDGTIDRLHDRGPGYPLLLAALGSAERPGRAVFYVTLLLHLVSVWVLGAVLSAAGVGPAALAVFCVLMLLPPSVESSAYVMTETPAQFLLVIAFACVLFWVRGSRPASREMPPRRDTRRGRGWLLAIAAVAIGAAALTRPTYQALAPAFAIVLTLLALAAGPAFAWRRAVTAGLALIVGAAVILGGYAAANRSATGYFGITPMMGVNLSTRTVTVIERLPDDYAAAREILIKMRDAQLVKPGSSHTGYSYIHDARPELARLTGLETQELSAYILRLNLWLIRAAPLQYLEEVARALGPYWFPSARELAIMDSRRLQFAWVSVHFALIGLFALQCIVMSGTALLQISRRLLGTDGGTVRAWLDAHLVESVAYVLAAVIVFYTMTLSCMFDVGDTRQRVPTDVFITFMTVLGGHWWWGFARGATLPRRSGATPADAQAEAGSLDERAGVGQERERVLS
jgi:hypothetical protein